MYTIWGALMKKMQNYEYKIKHKRYYFLKLEKKTQKLKATTNITKNPDNWYNILITFQHTCEIHSPASPLFG